MASPRNAPRRTHERTLFEKLESLRRQLIGMGAEVENQIRLAVEALVESDAAKARQVIERDKVIDQMEIKNDEDAIELLATQQPVASDLRLLVSSLKINADLERIGDHAVNIAEGAERMSRFRPFKPWIDIPHMAEIARGMLQEALDAFVRRDASSRSRSASATTSSTRRTSPSSASS